MEMTRGIDRLKAERGEATSSLSDLVMEGEDENEFGFSKR